MEVMHVLRNMDLAPEIIPFPEVISQLPGDWIDYIGIDSYPGYGFVFLTFNASIKLPSVNLQDALSTIIILHTIFL